jgi:hypothetical protein
VYILVLWITPSCISVANGRALILRPESEADVCSPGQKNSPFLWKPKRLAFLEIPVFEPIVLQLNPMHCNMEDGPPLLHQSVCNVCICGTYFKGAKSP